MKLDSLQNIVDEKFSWCSGVREETPIEVHKWLDGRSWFHKRALRARDEPLSLDLVVWIEST